MVSAAFSCVKESFLSWMFVAPACAILAASPLGHVTTEVGRRAMRIVMRNYALFVMFALGMVTDDTVHIYKLRELISDASVVWRDPIVKWTTLKRNAGSSGCTEAGMSSPKALPKAPWQPKSSPMCGKCPRAGWESRARGPYPFSDQSSNPRARNIGSTCGSRPVKSRHGWRSRRPTPRSISRGSRAWAS